jgi:glycosyltransferase involved in cell wall biosynthesis
LDISIFIPIYGESDRVEKMLTLFANQNVSKEIFVAVDEPTETFGRKIKDLKGENVTFVINSKRSGKANALNHTVGLSSGKVLLFLDSDIDLPDDPEYLRKIIRKMQHTDILDIKKGLSKASRFSPRWPTMNILALTSTHGWLHALCKNVQPLTVPRLLCDETCLKKFKVFAES